MLNDALLYLFEAVVILIKHGLGVVKVEVVKGFLFPRQIQHQVDIIGLNAVFRTLGIHAFQFQDFLVESFLGVGRPFHGFGAELALGDFLCLGVVAEFLLDLLQLLIEEILALLLVEFALDLGLDIALQREHLLFLVEQFQHPTSTGFDAGHFEQCLLFFHRSVHVGTDEIDQEGQALDALDGETSFGRNVWAELNDLNGEFFQALHQRFVLIVFWRQVLGVIFNDASLHVRFFLNDFRPLEAFLALKDDRVAAVGHAQHLDDLRDGSDFIEVLAVGDFNVVVFLTHDTYAVLELVGLLDQPNGSVPANRDGNDHSWEQNGIAQRQEGKGFGHLLFLHRLLVFRRYQRYELVVLGITQSPSFFVVLVFKHVLPCLSNLPS